MAVYRPLKRQVGSLEYKPKFTLKDLVTLFDSKILVNILFWHPVFIKTKVLPYLWQIFRVPGAVLESVNSTPARIKVMCEFVARRTLVSPGSQLAEVSTLPDLAFGSDLVGLGIGVSWCLNSI